MILHFAFTDLFFVVVLFILFSCFLLVILSFLPV